MRIALMVVRLILFVPYYFTRIWYYSILKTPRYDKAYAFIRKVAIKANRAGRVKVEVKGLENIPKEEAFIFYPNHQGMFDVLAIFECCDVPFGFVSKKEAVTLPLVKQVVRALGAIAIDREDIKQSMKVILQMAEEVKQGRNFLIFPEGTRSRDGNKVHDFKGGSFKAAQRASCPIVPVALVDCFRPFDEQSIKKVTVKVEFLKPLYPEEYKLMKSVDIAECVKERIAAVVEK